MTDRRRHRRPEAVTIYGPAQYLNEGVGLWGGGGGGGGAVYKYAHADQHGSMPQQDIKKRMEWR